MICVKRGKHKHSDTDNMGGFLGAPGQRADCVRARIHRSTRESRSSESQAGRVGRTPNPPVSANAVFARVQIAHGSEGAANTHTTRLVGANVRKARFFDTAGFQVRRAA